MLLRHRPEQDHLLTTVIYQPNLVAIHQGLLYLATDARPPANFAREAEARSAPVLCIECRAHFAPDLFCGHRGRWTQQGALLGALAAARMPRRAHRSEAAVGLRRRLASGVSGNARPKLAAPGRWTSTASGRSGCRRSGGVADGSCGSNRAAGGGGSGH